VYRIGKIAKTFRISKEALRYYERNGIVRPTRDEDSGYRYYDRADIQRVATIKKMQNMNFSLEEIKAVFTGLSTDTYIKWYDSKIDELEKQIYFHQQIVNRMKWQSDMIKYGSEELFRFSIREGASFARIEFGDFERLLSDLELNRITSDWFRYMAIVNASTRIDMKKASYGELIEAKGLMVAKETLSRLDLMTDELVDILDFNRYVYGIIRIETGQQNPFEESILRVLQYLQDENLKIRSDLFTNVIASFSENENNHIVYSQIYLQVE